jgi:hypothetical protein
MTAFVLAAGAAAPTPARAEPTRILDVAPLAAAAQAPPVTATPNSQMFGLGIRLGGVTASGVGASLRYFFGGGPLGLQAEVSRYGHGQGPVDWSSVQFAPAVMYRFQRYQFEAPLSLTPHAGGGLSIVHYSFDQDDPLLDPFGVDDTDIGLQLFGGVELFFRNAPNVGVSGGFTVTTHDNIGTMSIGGPAFTVAGHWYFW